MNKEFWSEENLKSLIDRTYSIAKEHGFHDTDLSIRHCLMLVITEISEAVEADRKGKYADMRDYNKEYMEYEKIVRDKIRFRCAFEYHVKNTADDELADVCIRIFDLCGMLGIVPKVPFADNSAMEAFCNLFGKDTFCERMYELTSSLSEYSDGGKDLNDADFMEETLGSSLFFVMCLCKHMGIDLERHIEMKMRYNEIRPSKHGKKY